jgi:hypothetical protein
LGPVSQNQNCQGVNNKRRPCLRSAAVHETIY